MGIRDQAGFRHDVQTANADPAPSYTPFEEPDGDGAGPDLQDEPLNPIQQLAADRLARRPPRPTHIGGNMYQYPDGRVVFVGSAGEAALAAKASKPEAQLFQSGREGDPLALLYGYSPHGGTVFFRKVVSQYGNMVIGVLWGMGNVNSIVKVQMHGEDLPATVLAHHYTGNPAAGNYGDVDSYITQVEPTYADTLVATDEETGLEYSASYSVFVVPYFLAGNGVPQFTGWIQGHRLYDDREGAHVLANEATWTYSANAALVQADLAHHAIRGLGLTLDWPSVSTAATDCEGSRPREIHTRFSTPQEGTALVAVAGDYASTILVPDNNVVRMVVLKDETPIAALTVDDTIGGFRIVQKPSRQRPDIVEVEYTHTDPTDQYRRVTKRVQAKRTGLTANAHPHKRQVIPMYGFDDRDMAYQYAVRRLNMLRGDIEVSWRGHDRSIEYTRGDVLTCDDGIGLSTFRLRLADATYMTSGHWAFKAAEDAASMYSTSPAPDSVNLPDPPAHVTDPYPPVPTAFACVQTKEGERLTWTHPTDASEVIIRGYVIRRGLNPKTIADWDTMTEVVALAAGDGFNDTTNATPLGLNTWLIRSVSTTGELSVTAASVNQEIYDADDFPNSGPTVSTQLWTDPDGFTRMRTKVTFTANTWGLTLGYRVRLTNTTANPDLVLIDQTFVHTNAETYEVVTRAHEGSFQLLTEVFTIGPRGEASTAQSINAYQATLSITPAVPTALFCSQYQRDVLATWAAPTDTKNIVAYALRRGTTSQTVANWASMTVVSDRIDGLSFLDTDVTPGDDQRYFIRAVAYQGSLSATADSDDIDVKTVENYNFMPLGNFPIWQESAGNPLVDPISTKKHFADVFIGWRNAWVGGVTYSKVAGRANGFAKNALRIHRTSGNTSTASINWSYAFEEEDVAELRGKFLTIDCYVQTGANFTVVSNLYPLFVLRWSSVKEGNIFTLAADDPTGQSLIYTDGVSGPGHVPLINGGAHTWQRLTGHFPVIIPTDTVGMSIGMTNGPAVGTAGANDWFEVSEFQLFVGDYYSSQSSASHHQAPDYIADPAAIAQRRVARLVRFDQATGQAANLAHVMRATPTEVGTSAPYMYIARF